MPSAPVMLCHGLLAFLFFPAQPESSSELSSEHQLLSQMPKLSQILPQFLGIMHPRVSGWPFSQFVPFLCTHTSVCLHLKLGALQEEVLEGLGVV